MEGKPSFAMPPLQQCKSNIQVILHCCLFRYDPPNTISLRSFRTMLPGCAVSSGFPQPGAVSRHSTVSVFHYYYDGEGGGRSVTLTPTHHSTCSCSTPTKTKSALGLTLVEVKDREKMVEAWVRLHWCGVSSVVVEVVEEEREGPLRVMRGCCWGAMVCHRSTSPVPRSVANWSLHKGGVFLSLSLSLTHTPSAGLCAFVRLLWLRFRNGFSTHVGWSGLTAVSKCMGEEQRASAAHRWGEIPSLRNSARGSSVWDTKYLLWCVSCLRTGQGGESVLILPLLAGSRLFWDPISFLSTSASPREWCEGEAVRVCLSVSSAGIACNPNAPHILQRLATAALWIQLHKDRGAQLGGQWSGNFPLRVHLHQSCL